MAPIKRKRPHDEHPQPEPEPSVTRRATRQTSIAPLPIQADPEPRRRRRRGDTVGERDDAGRGSVQSQSAPAVQPLQESHRIAQQQSARPAETMKATRSTRHGSTNGVTVASVPSGAENIRPTGSMSLAPSSAAAARPQPIRPRQSVIAAPTNPTLTPVPVPALQSQLQLPRPTKPIVLGTATASPQQQQQQQQPQQKMHQPLKQAAEPEKPGSGADRNIDKVVLGNICFKAWYPSYYGKEVLGDITGNSAKGNSSQVNGSTGADKPEGGGKNAPRRDRESQPMLDRLYVCPCCFKYSKELVAWWEHVRVCERRCYVPGTRIYVHPRGRRVVQRPVGNEAKLGRKKRGDAAVKTVDEVIEDQGEWSIWEVDGEKEGNLSLFAKLFLDNKSVFFDVTGFNYFLLVYTPPPDSSNSTGATPDAVPPRPQIVGFFSKEKMSWDNNNLACILVFPPWQRKGLGAILMGVSYEISRREGILGGPEKPISDLGKKGYKRFWAGEVARWLLSLDIPEGEGGRLVDINECSKATWVVPEDCLLVLREMGVVEDAGFGPPKGEPPVEGEEDAEKKEVKDVQRVRILRDSVRAWVKANRVNLEGTCDPRGFIEGYAIKQEEEVIQEA